MSDLDDCRGLFRELKRERLERHQRPRETMHDDHEIAFISKHATRHNGKAIVLYSNKDMELLSRIFKDGERCGEPIIFGNYQFFPGVIATRAMPLYQVPGNFTLREMIDACDDLDHCNGFTTKGVLMHVMLGPELFDTVTADLRHGMYIKPPTVQDMQVQVRPVLPKVLIQRFIPNPLTINQGHKFDLRVYLIITSTEPLVAFYHRGFLRVSLSKYDAAHPQRQSHITNTAIAKKMFKKNADLAKFQMRTFDDFQKTLLDEGIVTDPKWVKNSLELQIKRSMVHLVKAVYPKLTKRPGLYSVYGCDFILDDKLKLWFVEANRSPAFQGTTREKGILQRNMLSEILDLEELLADMGAEGYSKFSLNHLEPILYIPTEKNNPTAASSKHECGETYFSLFDEDCSTMLRELQV